MRGGLDGLLVVVIPHVVIVIDDEHPVFSACRVIFPALVHAKASAQGIVVALHEHHVFPLDHRRKDGDHGIHTGLIGAFIPIGIIIIVTAEEQSVSLFYSALLLERL